MGSCQGLLAAEWVVLMADHFKCVYCNEEYWNVPRVKATIEREEQSGNYIQTTVWTWTLCEKCANKMLADLMKQSYTVKAHIPDGFTFNQGVD